MATTLPEAQPQAGSKPDAEEPRLWNVVLLDDQDHTYEYVIEMVQRLFGHSKEKAFQIAKAVDTRGRAICLTTHKEHAELKRDQIHAYGRDPRMLSSKGSMGAIIEPAFADGGDDEDRGPDVRP